jgi:putative exporter of polyketide antibiotics
MTLQILNGTIDPNWVMVILLALTAFLLGRVLNRIDKKQDLHESKINDHEVRITVIEKKEP